MTIGAVVAAVGALFLGEYEFDEALPIGAGPLLGLVIAEIVVSLGRHRSKTMAAILAVWAATAVLLAGHLDANDVDAIKPGAYLSAALAALAAGLRGHAWFHRAPQDPDQGVGGSRLRADDPPRSRS